MIKKIIRLFATVGITAMGRVLGYARDVLLAALFGTSLIAEVFVYAFRFQLFWRTLFADQTITSLLVPALTVATQVDPKVQRCLAISARLGAVFVAIAVLAQPLFVFLMANGLLTAYASDQPGWPTWTLAAFAGIGASLSLFGTFQATVLIAGLQAKSQFRRAACVPLVFNIVLMATVIVAWSLWRENRGLIIPIGLLSIGICAAGFAQVWIARRLTASPLPNTESSPFTMGQLWSISRKGAGRFTSLAMLRLFEPLPLIIVSSIASGTAGYLTGLYLAERLTMLLPSIIGLVLGAILLTDLSKAVASNNRKKATRVYLMALVLAGGMALLGAIFFSQFVEYGVSIAFGRGAFDQNSIDLVVAFLTPLIWFIPFASIEYVAMQPFVIGKRVLVPVIMGALATSLSVVLALVGDGSPSSYAWAIVLPAMARIGLLAIFGWTVIARRPLTPSQSSDR